MYNTAMKKILMILIVMALALTASACNDASMEQVQQTAVAAPSPTIAVATQAPTIVPTSVPTTVPTLIPTTTPAPTPTYIFVGQVMCSANEYVNIREHASTDSEIVGALPSGESADVIEFLDGWVHISYGRTVGYVSSDYTIRLCIPDVPVPMGEWAMILVNPTNLLPEGFVVELADFEGGQVDSRILEVATAMFADAKKAGVDLMLVDAFRSEATQSAQFEAKVQQYIDKGYSRADAQIKAATITARPNTSEHQTGLVLDIVTPTYTKRNSGFADTEAFKWLDENAHNYGFTLRYKEDKQDITKVIFESWLWRYVGVEAADAMKVSGECLEEYLGILD